MEKSVCFLTGPKWFAENLSSRYGSKASVYYVIKRINCRSLQQNEIIDPEV